jgi:hypothetical protein
LVEFQQFRGLETREQGLCERSQVVGGTGHTPCKESANCTTGLKAAMIDPMRLQDREQVLGLDGPPRSRESMESLGRFGLRQLQEARAIDSPLR